MLRVEERLVMSVESVHTAHWFVCLFQTSLAASFLGKQGDGAAGTCQLQRHES